MNVNGRSARCHEMCALPHNTCVLVRVPPGRPCRIRGCLRAVHMSGHACERGDVATYVCIYHACVFISRYLSIIVPAQFLHNTRQHWRRCSAERAVPPVQNTCPRIEKDSSTASCYSERRCCTSILTCTHQVRKAYAPHRLEHIGQDQNVALTHPQPPTSQRHSTVRKLSRTTLASTFVALLLWQRGHVAHAGLIGQAGRS